ncbi:MOSC domain-containing protein [Ktedonospora formicarum]|uniref:MOSC domain-containing protein n=1 Tax=Ktedonospora formicarum TaxID=2778364 RepID=A0A8J3MQY2_9CHLR|nr:MOSC N-terminal beta barrel domain-containing protein [Ktedonospora formicarum]GHO45357.1 MOSC domain-containing protein [Ktedonospora formicarum]
MVDIVLSRICVYPIKGCGGTEVREAQMYERGLWYDRRWMLAYEEGPNLHQLAFPQLATIRAFVTDDCLQVRAPGMPLLSVPLEPQWNARPLAVQWFEGRCKALPVSDKVDEWFRDFLHVRCRLVFLTEDTRRSVMPEYTIKQEQLSFTSYQYHLLSEESLGDLNRRLAMPVPMDRFRPNLVVAGAEAFAEDGWKTIKIGNHTFQTVRACDRCAITTVDQARGIMTGKEPLATLARYRTFGKKVLFGQYLFGEGSGTIRVGDTVQVLEYQEPPGVAM